MHCVHTSMSPAARNADPRDSNWHSCIVSALSRSASCGRGILDTLCSWGWVGAAQDSSGYSVGLEAGGAGDGMLPWPWMYTMRMKWKILRKGQI